MEHRAISMGLFIVLSFSAAILFLEMDKGDCAEIVGGRESVLHSRPYMALILGSRYCGGTLIRDNWVLTAAHCTITKNTTIILGVHSISEPEEGEEGFRIAGVVRHLSPRLNDIMLLRLRGRARLNQRVQTIKLPSTFKDVRVGTRCLAAGWGKTEKGEPASDMLHEVKLIVKDRDFCKKQYLGYHPITTNMTCAGGVKNEWKGACQGDSGGPLICQGIQRGITSFGKATECGDPNYPSVFTRLTKDYINWIHDIIQG